MLTHLAARDILVEDSRKANGMAQPYQGMTRLDWRGARSPKVAEEIHKAYLQDRWTNVEGRNKRRFLATFPQLTGEELRWLKCEPSDALPRWYDMDLRYAITVYEYRGPTQQE